MNNRSWTILRIIGASCLLAVFCFLIFSGDTKAQINPMINFAGKVTNIDGSELSDGTYNFDFAFFTTPTGGASIWSENLRATSSFSATIGGVTAAADSIVYDYSSGSATGTLRVGQYLSNASTSEAALIIDYDTTADTVTVASGSPVWSAGEPINNRPYVEGGVVDVNLGAATDLSGVNFDQPLYLEVTFNGEKMQPRKIITAAPQAFDAARLGGKSQDAFGSLTEDEIITGQWSFENIASMASSSADAVLTITQNGSGDIVEFKQGATTSLAVLASGQVQIGNYKFPVTYGSSGYVLKSNGSGNLNWALDLVGVGGGGAGFWATSADDLLISPVYDTYSVVIGGYGTTTLPDQKFEVQGAALFDNVYISNQQQVRFYDTDSSNYMALRATGTLAGNYTLSLPADAGFAGQSLVTDGNGNLSWMTVGAAGTFDSLSDVDTGGAGWGNLVYYTGAGTGWVDIATGSLGIDLANTTGTLGIGRGGTGSTTPSGILGGDGAGLIYSIADNSANWNTAFLWGNHAAANYFSTSSGRILEVAYGGTGANTLADLITLGTHTLGNYVASTTGSNTITITGTPGEGWVPAFSVTDSSIGEVKLNVTNADGAGLALVSNGDGTFRWEAAGASSGYVMGSQAGQLAFYQNNGITATGTTNLYWNNSQYYLGVGTTSPGATLTVGTDGDGFRVNNYGQVIAGTWMADAIADTYIASSSYWNQAYYWGNHANANYFSTSTGRILEIGYGGTGANLTDPAADRIMFWDESAGTGAVTWLEFGSGLQITGTTLNTVGGGGGGAVNLWATTSDQLAIYTNPSTEYAVMMGGSSSSTAEILFDPKGGYSWINTGGTFGLGTTTPSALLTVGATVGQQLLVNASGVISGGAVWQGTPITDAYIASSSYWNTATNIVNASSTSWYQAYLWGDHTAAGYLGRSDWFATTTDGLDEGITNLYSPWSETGANIYYNIGSVGIGTATPNNLLSVYGNFGALNQGEVRMYESAVNGNDYVALRASSTLVGPLTWTLPVSDGASGNALMWGANGELSWSTPSGTGGTITGATVAGQIPYYAAASNALTPTSTIFLLGGYVGIGTTTPAALLTVGTDGDGLRINHAGEIIAGSWLGDVIDIAYGGTGASTAADARENFGLADAYKFGVNSTGTVGWLWQSDGDGRGQWVATGSLGITGDADKYSRFIGTTTATTDGEFSTSTLRGYQAANNICTTEYSGSHFCRTYDILVTIDKGNISNWSGSAWIAEGPPGYTSNSNDCNGWVSSSSIMLGAFWALDSDGGGAGWLTNCSGVKPLACCKEQ